MPCCCAKNVKAAFVLGIVLAVFKSFLYCLPFFFVPSEDQEGTIVPGIIIGIIYVMINCFLIFGAHKRHSTAILVWMVLAILELCILAILAMAVVFNLKLLMIDDGWKADSGISSFLLLSLINQGVLSMAGIVAIYIVFFSVYIILLIWTIILAKNAKKEIEADGSDLDTIRQHLISGNP